MQDESERQADIEVATDALAKLMLRYGECYNYDNADISDARVEADEIASVALMDMDAKSVLNRQIGELQSTIGRLQADNARLRIAFHDAVRRPLGVTPDSGAEFYDPRMADEAEARRPLIPR